MKFVRGQEPKAAMGIGRYIYDNGFGPRWYVCNYCKSTRLEMKVKDGFQPPDYICKDCGHTSGAPTWVKLNPKTGYPYKGNKTIYRDPITNEVKLVNFVRGSDPKVAMGIGRAANAITIMCLDVSGVVHGKFKDSSNPISFKSNHLQDPIQNISISIVDPVLEYLLEMLKDPALGKVFQSEIKDLLINHHKIFDESSARNCIWNYESVEFRRLTFHTMDRNIDGIDIVRLVEFYELIGKDIIYNGTLYPISDKIVFK